LFLFCLEHLLMGSCSVLEITGRKGKINCYFGGWRQVTIFDEAGITPSISEIVCEINPSSGLL